MLGGVEAVRRWRSLREAMADRLDDQRLRRMEPARRAKSRRPREFAIRGAADRRHAGACGDRECGRARRGGQPAALNRCRGFESAIRSCSACAPGRHRRAPPGDRERRSGTCSGASACRSNLLDGYDVAGPATATGQSWRRSSPARSDRSARVERLRVDFIANASHELRTPLASLVGFIETLQGRRMTTPRRATGSWPSCANRAGAWPG